jgi:DNA-binding MarR family transcriptional regulator
MLSPNDSPGFLLWQTHNRWQRALKRVLRPFGLTHAQFALLAAVGHLTPLTKVTQSAAAELLDADAMMISTLCRDLEARRLLTRGRHATDNRAVVLALTAQGQKVMDAAFPAVIAFDEEFFGDQSEPLLDSLRSLDWQNAPNEEENVPIAAHLRSQSSR